jgi:hypothetical protein
MASRTTAEEGFIVVSAREGMSIISTYQQVGGHDAGDAGRGKAEAVQLLQEFADSWSHAEPNSWEAALYAEVAGSDWFIKRWARSALTLCLPDAASTPTSRPTGSQVRHPHL